MNEQKTLRRHVLYTECVDVIVEGKLSDSDPH